MVKREFYLGKIEPFVAKPVIKIITGMRRVGKSVLIKQLIDLLGKRGVSKKNILYINKESLEFDFLKDYRDLNNYVNGKMEKCRRKKYLFIDEIQEIKGWEKTINSIFAAGGSDIYITGSNAQLLASEISTLISGRYIEFNIYPLGFTEFIEFRGGRAKDKEEEFNNYLKYGGLPGIHYFDLREEVVYQYLNSIYDTIVLKDIIRRNSLRNFELLENIYKYIFHNIGNIFSAKKISDYLKSQKLNVGVDTIQNYLKYITSTFTAFKVKRFDLKGKRILEIYEKYYAGDLGIRHSITGYNTDDISALLENIIYLELKRRGYNITIGKLYNTEIDFIAKKEDKIKYIQVCYILASKEVVDREFKPLLRIKDNYSKYVLSMDKVFGKDYKGIKRINIIDFLLSNW